LEFFALGHGHLVTAVVILILLVSSDPIKGNMMLFTEGQKPIPQVRIKSRLFVCLHPSSGLPAFGPAFGETIHQIFGI